MQASRLVDKSLITSRSITPSRTNMSSDESYNIYAYVPQPKFVPEDYLTYDTTIKDIYQYKEVFDLLDTNNDGAIQPKDLRKVFQQCGYNTRKEKIYQMMSDFDTDESGIIEFKEFVGMMTMKPCKDDTEDDIRNIFDSIDQDCKGYITLDDLRTLADDHNDEVNDEDLKEMIKQCDPNGEGRINFEAFLLFNRNHDHH